MKADFALCRASECDELGNFCCNLATKNFNPLMAMEVDEKGNHKILKECTLPYTELNVVNMIIMEMGVAKRNIMYRFLGKNLTRKERLL